MAERDRSTVEMGVVSTASLSRRDQHRVRPHLEVGASRRAFSVPALPLQGEHRGRLRVLGAVLDVIDADRLTESGPRNERPIRLLHHHRRPAVVVTGFPNDEAATFWFRHG
jgi:hypothetical protein